ncbi:MAG: hypothetical protein KKG60_00535, partial [Nanoarchaeota archaeon]|nr:hypothetical protein [Nanoarchaeota archaeon]
MLFTAGNYIGEEGRRYLAVYNFNRDIYIKLPPEVNAKLEAHFKYTFGRKHGAVNVFSLEKNSTPEKQAKLCKDIITREEGFHFIDRTWRTQGERFVRKDALEDAVRKYNVDAQILGSLPEKMRNEITTLTLADIVDFCGDNPAKHPVPSCIRKVKKITPVTEAKYINPARYLTRGKQDFVEFCHLQGNYDPTKGCISSWIPAENASFDGKFFRNYWLYIHGECGDCYAKNKHKTPPKNIYKFDRQGLIEDITLGILDLEKKTRTGKSVDVIRLGKRVESFVSFNKDVFLEILEIGAELKKRFVIPTKFLPFDKTIKNLISRTQSSILYSVGNFDKFEQGAVLHGCSTDWRLEQAVRYGANLYLNILGHAPPTKKDLQIIGFAKKYKLNIQLIPRRFHDQYWAKEYTGLDWRTLKSPVHQADAFEPSEPYEGTY